MAVTNINLPPLPTGTLTYDVSNLIDFAEAAVLADRAARTTQQAEPPDDGVRRAAANVIAAWDAHGTPIALRGWIDILRERLAETPAPAAPQQAEPVCPHIRSSGPADRATNWCALNDPPAPQPPALPDAAREAMRQALDALLEPAFDLIDDTAAQKCDRAINALRAALKEDA